MASGEAYSTTYEQSGVNVELGDDLPRVLYEAAKLTWANRQGVFGEMSELHGSFSGFRAMPLELFGNTEGILLGMSDDGVGTKVEIAERLADHSTVAHDLFAMVCDDAVVRGAEPIAVTTTLDVRRLDNSDNTRQAIEQLARGYVEAAAKAGVAVVNGEVAELGDRVSGYGSDEGGFNYNWSATVLWAAHESRLLSGREIQPGQTLVGLNEKGFRSNGLTLARKILADKFGPQWHEHVMDDFNVPIGQLVATPSTIYSRLITQFTGGYDLSRPPQVPITGLAHITGGGLPSKLARMLEPSGFGAVITDPIEPPTIMKRVQSLGDISDREAYNTWNMGQGMVIATTEPISLIMAARQNGFGAQVIGKVIRNPVISIESHGIMERGRWFNYFI